jgi:hypothetical protein
MNDIELGLLMVVGAYSLVIVGGFITGTMLLPPVLSFRREEQPSQFWIAAAANGVIAVLALFTALNLW